MSITHHASSNGHHHTDDPIEVRIFTLINAGKKLAFDLFEAHRKRAFLKSAVNPPAWRIREELARIEDELEPLLAEWESRRI